MLSIYDRFVVSATSGAVLAGSTVTVNNVGGALASLYSDIDGVTPVANPYSTGPTGRAQFYLAPGRYNITASNGVETLSYPNFLVGSELIDGVRTLPTFADLATTSMQVGQVFRTVGHTIAGLGSLTYRAVSGSVTSDGGTQINSATAGVYAKAVVQGYITPEMFGCISTSTAIEATRAINKCYVYASANKGVVVMYEQSAYQLDGNIDGTVDDATAPDPQGRGGIQVKSNTTTLFTGQTFTQVVSPYTGYALLNLSNASNFTIKGQATFIGDALIHGATGGEYGHGIYVANAHSFAISDITVKTCWGDGCYISDTDFSDLAAGTATASSNGTFNNCTFDSNRRQGLSGINGTLMTFNKCRFINTGRLVATAPGAGVDLETDASPYRIGMQHWRFNDCEMDNNVGPNTLIFPTLNNGKAGCEDIVFNNCKMTRTGAQGSYWSDRAETYVKNIVVNGGVIEGGVYACNGTTFNDVKISRSMSDVGASTYAVELSASTHNTRFNNCEIVASGDTTINSKKLLFSAVGPGEANKPTFTKCKFVHKNVYGGATNVTLITRTPMTFTECEFLTEGTAPASYAGFDISAGASRVSPSYAMLYRCYIDPTWHSGIAYFQGRVNLNTIKTRTATYTTNNLVPCGLADCFDFDFTGSSATNMTAPTDPFIKRITIRVKNTSGGALGALTWNAVYKMSAWTQPAAGFNRSIQFEYDGTNWIQVGGASIDVPN